MLIVLKENQFIDSIETNEVLFMQEREPLDEIWNGRRLGVDKAEDQL